MMPLVGGYIKMLSGLMGGISVNESMKKILTLLVVMVLRRVLLDFIYFIVFTVFTNRILRTVLMGVYVFVLLRVGM